MIPLRVYLVPPLLLLLVLLVMPYDCVPLCKKSYKTLATLTRHQNSCRAYGDAQHAANSARIRVSSTEWASRTLATRSLVGLTSGSPSQNESEDSIMVSSNEISSDVNNRAATVATNTTPSHDAHMMFEPQAPRSPSPLAPSPPPPPPPPPSPPPRYMASGRRMRVSCGRLPPRFRDTLPQTAPINVASETPPAAPRLPRILLIVRDQLATMVNTFGMWREYLHRPSFDPDQAVAQEDIANRARFPTNEAADEASRVHAIPDENPPWPFANMSVWRFMRWLNNGSSAKSETDADRLVHEVLLSPDFKVTDLHDFSANRENKRLDNATSESPGPFDNFKTAKIDISVPSGDKNKPPDTYSIPGLYYRDLISVIKAAFADPIAAKYHLSPFKLFHQRPGTDTSERVYGELYTSDEFISEHDRVQRAPVPPNDPTCKREKVVAALMYWSDSTHLANFGTAKLWPIYMFLGNLSKYIRAQPTSGACHHLAYLPSLPDTFEDWAKGFHAKWATQKGDILTHCRRELFHAVWKHLLNDEFLAAYKYGIVIKCIDGVERRVYPRIFTYSADYPEKVLIATIRDKGLCPCPRCLVSKMALDKMGQRRDRTMRGTLRRIPMVLIERARGFIYDTALPIGGAAVNSLLKASSSIPVLNAFTSRLSNAARPDDRFDTSRILVVDLLHEFELGVWKALFTHLIRMLYASPNGGQLVDELNLRYRSTPTFGNSTIRKFANNAADMKKLAARDFEDLLQCSIPAFSGLFGEPHNKRLMKLLYRMAQWHSLAKLRMHTDSTVTYFDNLTTELGQVMRDFEKFTCSEYNTVELPKETAARIRRQAQTAQGTTGATAASQQPAPATAGKRGRTLNLFTYKWHALGDYAATIKQFGTTDSYSTQIGELAHRIVKRLYAITNKRDATEQIAKHYRRERVLAASREAVKKHIVKSKTQVRRGHILLSPPPHDSNVLPSAAAEQLDVPPECHFVISPSRSHPLPLSSFLRNGVADPARKDFIPKLQDHIFGRLRKESSSASDLSLGYTNEERNSVRILGNKIFSVQTMRINYTSYDIRRDQDCLNPRTDNRDIMLYAPQGDDDSYWYARVLGIFHATVLLHDNRSGVSQQPSHMEFLWVRWFGSVSGYRDGMHQAKLPKVGFVEDTVSDDNYAFGFLDPSLVLRACHLIPDFPTGRTNDRLAVYPGSYARRPDETNDWAEFYVNIFVDRDMCMRYFPGGGIGHSTFSTQLPLDHTNQDMETEVEDGEIELVAEPVSDDSDNDSDASSGIESVYSDDDELDVEVKTPA